MTEQLLLVWRFLEAQSPAHLVQLVSWHLLALFVVLGGLSGLGLHFLIGYVFRFYRRKDKHARWIAWPTLLVLLTSVWVLLGVYLLGVNAQALVGRNLTSEVPPHLGRLLLDPAFRTPTLSEVSPDEVPKEAIQAALRQSSELEYRGRLEAQLAGLTASAERVSGADVLVRMGLAWVTAPHATWLTPVREPAQGQGAGGAVGSESDGGAAGAPTGYFLPETLAGLIDELPAGTALPRSDWEYVAGTRFVDGVLRPLVVEYLTYLAIAALALVLLVDLVFLLFMRRLRRIGQPKPPKTKPAAKGAKALPAASPAAGAAAPAKPASPPAIAESSAGKPGEKSAEKPGETSADKSVVPSAGSAPAPASAPEAAPPAVGKSGT